MTSRHNCTGDVHLFAVLIQMGHDVRDTLRHYWSTGRAIIYTILQ